MGKFMISKFASTCKETSAKIKKGDPIYYDGYAYSSNSNKYKELKELEQLSRYIQAQENAYFDTFCLKNNI
jgi:hypothetical protein